MKRRDFLTACGGITLWSHLARAQQAGTKRIALTDPAVKITEMKIGGDGGMTAFLEELQRLGYIEGQNVLIQRYSAEGDKGRYADLAREVVSTQPDVILTLGTPLTLAFKAATNTIPIVTVTGDPIRFGLLSSLSHPGGNVTGVSVDAGLELWGKRLELLVEAVPKTRTVLAVSTQTAWDAAGGKVTRETAERLGISLIPALVSAPINEQSLRNTFETIPRDKVDGVIFLYASEFYAYRLLIVSLVKQVGLPAIYFARDQVEAGGLISYSNDLKEVVRIEAKQVDEVLRGRKPAEIPYAQAAKYELVVNLKAARVLGLEIPSALLTRADAVIE
jgi:putative ABC transport system substrate-binding protein